MATTPNLSLCFKCGHAKPSPMHTCSRCGSDPSRVRDDQIASALMSTFFRQEVFGESRAQAFATVADLGKATAGGKRVVPSRSERAQLEPVIDSFEGGKLMKVMVVLALLVGVSVVSVVYLVKKLS